MSATAQQISFPAGLVAHMREEVYGSPDGHLSPRWHWVKLFPQDMYDRGYIYILVDDAKKLRVGDPIQIDRTHATIVGIGSPEKVEDYSDGVKLVTACRITLSDDRKFI
jgi:hypothetical protein